jgi:hypothetical protein
MTKNGKKQLQIILKMGHLNMKTTVSLVLLLLLFSCQNMSSEDIYGKYSPISYKNSFDTLTINKDGIYNRRVYDKKEEIIELQF